jgi:uncharacterized protein with beta-barrel porin domain
MGKRDSSLRGGRWLLLTSSSVAALLIGGGASTVYAACYTGPFAGGYTDNGTAACIVVKNSSFSGNIVNNGALTPSSNPSNIGIQVVNSTITGQISNVGTIAGSQNTAIGIELTSATVTGGIVNSGTIAGALGIISVSSSAAITNTGVISVGNLDGIEVSDGIAGGGITNSGTISAGVAIDLVFTSTFTGSISNSGTLAGPELGIVVAAVETFTGNISNSGAIAVRTAIDLNEATINGSIVDSGTIESSRGITVDNQSAIKSTGTAVHISGAIFTGGITNAGLISAAGKPIWVGGLATSHASVTISTFAGGITNTGRLTAGGGNGIFVGGTADHGALTISTFSGGITNSGTISGADGGIVVGGGALFAGTLTISNFAGPISNSGVISTSGKGIWLGGLASNAGSDLTISTFSGGITNSGTISSSASDGIVVGGTARGGTFAISTFGGGINNSGTISAANSGIWVGGDAVFFGTVAISTFSGGITNSSTISAVDGNGIWVGGDAGEGSLTISTFSGGIDNSGAISAPASGAGGNGILVGGVAVGPADTTIATFSGGITNSGTISSGGNGIQVGGAASQVGASVAVSNFSGGITNGGTISAGRNGIWVGGSADGLDVTVTISTFGGGITNTGTITAGGKGIFVGGTAESAASVTISTFSGGITNSGTIIARTGIVVNNVSTFQGAIVNSGSISGTGGIAIDVSSAAGAMTIDQTAGLISGAIKLSPNADQLNISGGAIAGNIIGSGSQDIINFNFGSGTFTYGSAFGFSTINHVNVNSGTVILNGSNEANAVDVFGGATLAGTGTLDPLALTIHSGGTFSPGTPGTPGTFMNVTGNLALLSGATYAVYLNPTTSSYANVTGAATLAGNVQANFATGSYISKQYTILTTTNGLSGTFAGVTNVNLPAGFNDVLIYSGGDVLLSLTAGLGGGGTPFNPNQGNVAAAINNYFNNGGTLPPQFLNLFSLPGSQLANALSELDGQNATGAQTSAFTLMTEFLDLMLGQSGGGPGGGGPGGGAGGLGFAPDQQADALPPAIALAYDSILKAPPEQTFDQRWSTWASGFGGSSFLEGNTAAGTNNVNASAYGSAAGMEYRPDPNTRIGFAAAGSGLNWGLAQNLGTGRSDAFQAGGYAKTYFGAAYLSGALAFGNNWFATNRIASGDQLAARFAGQSYAIRGEAGYRFAVPLQYAAIGVTPYAALQTQWFHTPTYGETDLTGGGFGLTYAATTANDTRSELGTRFDDLATWNDKPLVLRASLAWAHDWENGTTLNAAFESLPGSAFTVNGAPLPPNSALTSASAQYFFTPNWSFTTKFDGELAPGGQTYAGSGTLKYTW